MKKLPKCIYVSLHKDKDCEWLTATEFKDEAIDNCEEDYRVGIYELKEVRLATIIKTLEAQK